MGCSFGVKLVRGAYIDGERRKATEHGDSDNVCSSYQKTNENYDRLLFRDRRSVDRCDNVNKHTSEKSVACRPLSCLDMAGCRAPGCRPCCNGRHVLFSPVLSCTLRALFGHSADHVAGHL
ncbi:hypothetical protein MRX96_048417 [Rhipicephalus microplus]